MTTRLIIYLLAMLTGFSAAEAARPVLPVPASVGADIGQAYEVVAVKAAEHSQDRPSVISPAFVLSLGESPALGAFSAIAPTTPILRYDVILG